MNTKLTLTIEKEVIEQAKQYASMKGKSLSELVENYFKFLTENQGNEPAETVSPRVQKLKGILKVNDDFDYKKVLEKEIISKHNG